MAERAYSVGCPFNINESTVRSIKKNMSITELSIINKKSQVQTGNQDCDSTL